MWIGIFGPVLGGYLQTLEVQMLKLGLIVYRIESHNHEKGLVEIWIYGRVDCNIEERPKDVIDHILEILDYFACLIDLYCILFHVFTA